MSFWMLWPHIVGGLFSLAVILFIGWLIKRNASPDNAAHVKRWTNRVTGVLILIVVFIFAMRALQMAAVNVPRQQIDRTQQSEQSEAFEESVQPKDSADTTR